MAVNVTVERRRCEANVKPNNDLPKPLMIEWEW